MDANPAGSTPGIIQVQIQVSQEAPGAKYKEVVKRATKRHELVEVDDFVFRRKRKAVAPPTPAQAAAGAAAAAVGAPTAPGCSPAAAVKQNLQLDGTRNSPAPAAAAEQHCDDATMTDQADAAAVADGFAAAVEPITAEAPATGDAAAAAAAAEADAAAAMDDDAAAQQQQQELTSEEEQEEDDDEAVAATEPAAPADPAALQFTVAPAELCDMVEWVFFSERKRAPGMTADAARKAAAQFKEQFAALLQQHQMAAAAAQSGDQEGDHQQQQDEGNAVAPGPQITVLPYLVEQQKAALLEKRDKLLQEEADWLQLQQQYNDMGPAAAGAADGCAADGCAAAAESGEGQQLGAAAAAASEGAAEAGTSKAAEAAPAAAPAGTEIAAAESAAARPDSPVGAVCAQQDSTIRGVALKVEMLLALVSKMEHLVNSAEVAARTLQVGYHAEKFKVFPHINSPAALIKSITSSQQAANPSQ